MPFFNIVAQTNENIVHTEGGQGISFMLIVVNLFLTDFDVGTDIDKIMLPVSRFGGAGRDKKKEALIRRLMAYFEKFRGLV